MKGDNSLHQSFKKRKSGKKRYTLIWEEKGLAGKGLLKPGGGPRSAPGRTERTNRERGRVLTKPNLPKPLVQGEKCKDEEKNTGKKTLSNGGGRGEIRGA